MNEFDPITEAIIGLQTGQIAQARVLRALIASHPDPDALRDTWRKYSATSIADAELSKARDPQRRAFHAALTQSFADWDARLAADPSEP